MKLLVSTALAALLACPAFAQVRNCAPRADVIERLEERYGETVQGVGLARQGAVEIFANTETGSWTITLTHPSGITCLVAAGRNYENVSGTGVEGDPA